MPRWTTVGALLLATGAAAGAEEIVLVNGERLRVDSVEVTEDLIIAQHPLLGRLELDPAVVARIEGLDEEQDETDDETPDLADAVVEQVAAETPETPRTPPLELPPASPWRQSFDVGFNGNEGTTRSAQTRVGYVAERTTPRSTFRFDSMYRYSTSRGAQTENWFTAGAYASWSSTEESRWSTFLEGRFDSAKFQAWDQRVTSGGGLAYRLVDVTKPVANGSDAKMSVFHLTMRGGGGIRREFGSLDDAIRPEALIGGDLSWRVNHYLYISANSTYYPSLEDTDDFRVVSRIDWTVALANDESLSLRLGLSHEHQSITAPGIEQDNLAVYATLVFTF